jgi:hypothetical protein
MWSSNKTRHYTNQTLHAINTCTFCWLFKPELHSMTHQTLVLTPNIFSGFENGRHMTVQINTRGEQTLTRTWSSNDLRISRYTSATLTTPAIHITQPTTLSKTTERYWLMTYNLSSLCACTLYFSKERYNLICFPCVKTIKPANP